MNLNIPDLNHSFSLITTRGITRTRRSKLVQELLTQLQGFCSTLAKFPVGHTEVVDTLPCQVIFEVTGAKVVNITFKGDEEKVEPVVIETSDVTFKFKGFPADNNTIGTLVTSLLLRNTQNDEISYRVQ